MPNTAPRPANTAPAQGAAQNPPSPPGPPLNAQVITPPEKVSKNPISYWLIAGLIMLILVTGGVLVYLKVAKSGTSSQTTKASTNNKAVITRTTPPPTQAEIRERQLNNDLSDIEASLKTLDNDSSSLDQALNDVPGDLTDQ